MDPIIVVPYRAEWRTEFAELGAALRSTLGELAIRIDHIGSTSVEGLAAKPIVDVQISVEALEPVDRYKGRLESIGFRHRADNEDLTKRYFRETPGQKRVHIHVREAGSWSEQFALLFRDYLRSHPDACTRYAEEKLRLAERYRDRREQYVGAKGPIIWQLMREASDWSQHTGWKPGRTDA